MGIFREGELINKQYDNHYLDDNNVDFNIWVLDSLKNLFFHLIG